MSVTVVEAVSDVQLLDDNPTDPFIVVAVNVIVPFNWPTQFGCAGIPPGPTEMV